MTNIELYKNAFIEGLELAPTAVESASVESVEKWDSIGQMSLVALVEEAFDIEFEPEELMTFTSYAAGLNLLKKYGIEL